MYRIISRLLIFSLFIIIVLIVYLSTVGIKTSRFNDLITEKIKENDPRFVTELQEVFLKLDLSNREIRISTKDTELYIKKNSIKLSEININLDLLSFLKNINSIKNLEVESKENSLKDLSSFFKSYKTSLPLMLLNNKIKKGFISLKATINFNNTNGKIINYKVLGTITDANVNILNEINAKNINFNFLIEKDKYTFENIQFDYNDLKISSKEVEIKKNKKDYLVKGFFKNITKSINPKTLSKFINFKLFDFIDEKIILQSDNKFSFTLNKKYRIKNFKITSTLNFEKINLNYKFDKIKNILVKYDDKINLEDGVIKLNFLNNKLFIEGKTKYKIDDKLDTFSFSFSKEKNQNKFDAILSLDNSEILLSAIDYEKKKNEKASLEFKTQINNDKSIIIKNIKFSNKDNYFIGKKVKFNNDFKILSIDEIEANYKNIRSFKNHFKLVKNKNTYNFNGDLFDFSKNLDNLLKKDDESSIFNLFKNLNATLDINIKKIYLDQKNFLKNFKGKVFLDNNKVYKADLKSKFQNNKNFNLTIYSKNNEKITTLYSDHAEPFVRKFDFVRGFKNGKIDFYSIKKKNVSNSVIKIYDFNLKKVPVLTKILSLASLQGIADLMTGQGIRFDEFEMNFKNEKKLMTIDEIYSIGPAISILMRGYVEKDKLISLRGTLVPATTINKTIGSIPVLGDILIGKKIGEGVFGVSFKIKGPPKNLKTTVNPIKTLTPRFITRTLEQIKN